MNDANIRKILELAIKNRYMGVDKATLLRAFRGMSYDNLKTLCENLEKEGLATVEWFQNGDIVVIINDNGMKYLEDRPSDGKKTAKEFQCPVCNTIVDGFVEKCHGCGAEFE